NKDRMNQGAQYVRNTLLENLRTGKVKLPTGDGGDMKEVTMQEFGISFPVLVDPVKVEEVEVSNPNADTGVATTGKTGGMLGPGGFSNKHGALSDAKKDGSVPDVIELDRFPFVVHFCWQPEGSGKERESENPEENTFTSFRQP
ncbi:unnamed protein product, partial [marine sediment metagenome]